MGDRTREVVAGRVQEDVRASVDRVTSWTAWRDVDRAVALGVWGSTDLVVYYAVLREVTRG